MDFRELLCCKIGPFGCPRAVLIPHWVNSATVQTSFSSQWAEEESYFPFYTIIPLSGVVTSILPMSHQGYVQTIVSSEGSTYRGEWGL